MLNKDLKARLRSGGWRPIAEAPKDGTFVLLSGGNTGESDYDKLGAKTGRPVVGRYFIDGNDPDSIEYDEYWAFCLWDGKWRQRYTNPTHFKHITLPNQPDPDVLELIEYTEKLEEENRLWMKYAPYIQSHPEMIDEKDIEWAEQKAIELGLVTEKLE